MTSATLRNSASWRLIRPLKKLFLRVLGAQQRPPANSPPASDPCLSDDIRERRTVSGTESSVPLPQPLFDPLQSPPPIDAVTHGQDESSSPAKSLSAWDWQSYLPLTASSSDTKSRRSAVPPWKQQTVTSKFEIDTRTRHLVSMIRGATMDTSRLSRVADLCSHLHKFPDSTNLACKEGVVTCLLNVLRDSSDDTVRARVREVLSMVGHVQPPCGRGLRVLSIDGGGIRGIVAIELLRELERLSGQPIHRLFDLICGVSTGALLAFLVGPLRRPLSTVDSMYRQLSSGVFSQSRLRGSANLLWQHGYYDSEAWNNVLQQTVGHLTLTQCASQQHTPKVAVVSTLIGVDQPRVFVFRTYNHAYHVQSQYLGSCRHKVWEAVRASAAAPGYFSEFRVDNRLFQDGGLVVNNPTAVALYEARRLWPAEPLQCLVSVGTGRFAAASLAAAADGGWQSSPSGATSWVTKMMRIVDSATDTEGVHAMLRGLLPAHQYYRFNPYLSDSVSLDDTRPDTMQQLTADARLYVRKNGYKLGRAVTELTRARSRVQLVADWCRHTRLLHGV